MELLSIEHINENYLFYSDLRSVKKWMSINKLNIIRLGKKYFIREDEFVNMINKIAGGEITIKNIRVKPQVMNNSEKGIYAQLLRTI
jgi:hypothetical protein